MKVALIQMEIAEKNTPGNIVHGLDLLQEAAANSDIAVLPEIWTTGYSLGRSRNYRWEYDCCSTKDCQ